MNLFEKKLLAMFCKVEQDFRDETIAQYNRRADAQYMHWRDTLDGPQPIEYGRPSIPRSPEYVTHHGAISHTWEAYKAAKWYPMHDKARRDANAAVDYAKLHFVSKLAKKLANATKLRTDTPKLNGKLSLSGVVTGYLQAVYPNKDSFYVEMSIVHNHRYSGRGYTAYLQFPARFTIIKKAGEVVRPAAGSGRLSEKWLSENF